SLLPVVLALDDHRGSLSTADADRREAASNISTPERVKQRREDPRAACADRMAERHSASVDVRSLVIDAEDLRDREVDDREGLVDLEEVDIVERELRRFEDLHDDVRGRGRELLGRLGRLGG